MAKKHPLEVVLEHYINEDVEQAQKLFHQYIIQTARQKYEELMAEDDTILEDVDLSSLDDFDAEAEAEAIKAEEAYGKGLSEADEDESGEEVEVDAEMEAGEESEESSEDEGSETEERVADLEAELAELKAEFEKLMSDEDSDDEDSDDENSEEVEDSEEEMSDDAVEMEAGEESEEVKEDEDMDLDDMFEEVDLAEFEDLAESAMEDHLHKVRVETSEDNAGAGGQTPKLKVNATSPIPQRKLTDRNNAHPAEVRSTEHVGFDLEKAPAVHDLGKFSNTHKHAMAPLTKVPHDGDKSAMLNSDAGFGKENTVSPISGKARVKGV